MSSWAGFVNKMSLAVYHLPLNCPNYVIWLVALLSMKSCSLMVIVVELDEESHYKNLTKLVNVPFKILPLKTLNTIKGVNRYLELKLAPVEDIVDNLKRQGVSKGLKIIITKDGNRITTAAIILTLHGYTVPNEINVVF